MAETEQYTITEPELQLYNEDKDENYSLPSFGSMVVAARKGGPTQMKATINTSTTLFISKQPSSMDDTSSTVCPSTDESSVSSAPSGPLIKVVDQCYHQFKESDSFQIEYSLTEYESKLYLEDMKSRLDEPIQELELSEVDDDDDYDYLFDDELNDGSVLSLNTLENDAFDEFIDKNCKFAPQIGCLGLIQFGFSACRDEELNEFYYDDDAHLMRTRTDQSSIYDGDASWGPSEPVGEKFVTNEISFTKDGSSSSANNTTNVVTGIDLTNAEPVLVGPLPCDDNDQDKLKEDHYLVQETTGSVSSDWHNNNGDHQQEINEQEDDCDAASRTTTSVYLGTSSLAPFDEIDSFGRATEIGFLEDEDGNFIEEPRTELEPDGVKRQYQKEGNTEIQGFASDPNGARSTEDLEVLHLEPPSEIILEA